MIKEKFEPFSHPALPEKRLDYTKVYVKNKFLVVIQLAIIVYLEIIPQKLMEYFEHINSKSHMTFSLLQDFLVILLILLMIVLVIFWGKKVTKLQWNLSIVKKNIKLILLGLVGMFILSNVGWSLAVLLGQNGLSSNERGLQLLQKNMPLFLMLLLAAILGPLVEETVFRVGFFELLFKDHPFLAWFIGASIFGFLHVGGIFQSLNLAAFPPYFFAGVVLGWLYWKTRRVEVSATVHGTWNLISTLLSALTLM